MQLDYVKGHCGWDTVTLIPDGQIPAGHEIEWALKILAAPVDGGLEVGMLSRGDSPGEIRLRMIDSTSRDWIPMCGGMTQVIGKALLETFFRDRFAVNPAQPRHHFKLLTPSGVMPICVESENGRVTRVTTTMDGFAKYLYEVGVKPMKVANCEVLSIGDFCVFDLAALESAFPGHDFTKRNLGPEVAIVNNLLREYRDQMNAGFGVPGMMFDARPEGPGQFRIYPRFFSEDLAAARLPFEFQCGTGTVAVGIALAHFGMLPFKGDRGRILFEWGSQRTTPDPYGIRTSVLDLRLEDQRVVEASFSHSIIEIVAEGKLNLPQYDGSTARMA